jgi:hypothetical protein
MGSEKSADQAWDLVSSWFVIFSYFIGPLTVHRRAGTAPFPIHIDLGVCRDFSEPLFNCE